MPCRSPASTARPSPTLRTPARSSPPSRPSTSATAKGLTRRPILAELNQKLSAIQDAFIITIQPPPVRGIGTGGGFKMMVEDKTGRGLPALEAAAQEIVAQRQPDARARRRCFSLFNTRTPKVYADIDRVRAEMLGVPADRIFEALEIYLGSTYVNDFNILGPHVPRHRAGRRRLPTGSARRRQLQDAQQQRRRWCRSARWRSFSDLTGPYRVLRYNLYPAAEVQGSTLPGFSPAQALAAMEKIAAATLPPGFGFEWTELALQEKLVGNSGLLIFVASVVFVFLLLAAQYESWTLPLAVILIVPMCLLAAVSRTSASRHGRERAGADRIRRADRPRREERHPDRRIRPAGRRGGIASRARPR